MGLRRPSFHHSPDDSEVHEINRKMKKEGFGEKSINNTKYRSERSLYTPKDEKSNLQNK